MKFLKKEWEDYKLLLRSVPSMVISIFITRNYSHPSIYALTQVLLYHGSHSYAWTVYVRDSAPKQLPRFQF